MKLPQHITRSETEYHLFHSAKDRVVPLRHKNAFIDILKKKSIRYHYEIIDNDQVDGRIFKNLEHGMNASMRSIFDLVAQRRDNNLCKETADTDFDLQSTHLFKCAEKAYRFKFDDKFNIDVEIIAK